MNWPALIFAACYLACSAVAWIIRSIDSRPRRRRMQSWFWGSVRPPSHPMCRCLLIPLPPRQPEGGR